MYLNKKEVTVLRQALDTIFYATDLPKSARMKWRAGIAILDGIERKKSREIKKNNDLREEKMKKLKALGLLPEKKPTLSQKPYTVRIGQDRYRHDSITEIGHTYGIKIDRTKKRSDVRTIQKALRAKFKRDDIYVKYDRQLAYYERHKDDVLDKMQERREKEIADKSNEVDLPNLNSI